MIISADQSQDALEQLLSENRKLARLSTAIDSKALFACFKSINRSGKNSDS